MLCTPLQAQMASLPGGTFFMGGNAGEEDEQPSHPVSVRAFQIDRLEVSTASYDTCVRQGACTPAHYDDGACIMWTSTGLRRVDVPQQYRSPEYPVVCVTWFQARQYCAFKGKRLPTEAEWEYAAQAADNNLYAWGNDAPGAALCAAATTGHPRTSGSYPSNGWGLSDMTGNVWEWVEDRYQVDYYREHASADPKGPEVGRYRVIRGGGWYSNAAQLRIANRQWFVPECGEVSIGIRCAK
jgi:sulfatase modifying factor 1